MSNKKRENVSVENLTDMQQYLGVEMIEDYRAGHLTRRKMLQRLILICGGAAGAAALLVACGDSSATVPATSVAAQPTTAAAPTVTATTAAAPASPATTAAATAAPNSVPTPVPAKSPLSVPLNDPTIISNMLTFKSDTDVMAYVGRPKTAGGSYPGVILIHENRGLTDHIKDVARRLIKKGYMVVAPDLASRAGGTDKVGPDKITAYFANAKPEDLIKDLNAAVDFLGTQDGFKAGKYGAVGFCFGGGYTLRLAAANPKILAAVPYYGPVPKPASQMATTKAAILAIYGGKDNNVNAGIPDLEKTLKDSGKVFEKKIYDDANHAFNNDTGPNYNEKAALAAWDETIGWLDKYLKS